MTRLRMGRPGGLFLAAVLAAGCGGGGGGGTPLPEMTVSGRVTYDFVAATFDPNTGAGGLALASPQARPVRGAVVRAVQGSTALATGVTDADGNYTLTFAPTSASGLQIQALAETTSPPISVRDNTDGNRRWAIGVAITPDTTTQDLHAATGWTSAGYVDANRAAAPFAILDSMSTAAQRFLEVRSVTFPALTVYWSPRNFAGGDGSSLATGNIGISHFRPPASIYILGQKGSDTDEFDAHVIVHEWGHYFEENLSRSDSIGGSHKVGDVLDPRLAFGEGYGTALAAMLLPQPRYVDTFFTNATTSTVGVYTDAETEPAPSGSSGGNPADDPTPSAFSEMSVIRILYDLYDGANEAHDQVALGLGSIYDVLTGPQKTTDALTTLASFVAGVKAQNPASVTTVNTLLAHHGIGPITDQWGAGDTGTPSLAEMFHHLPALGGTAVDRLVTLERGFEPNKWQQGQYFVVTGTGRNVRVTATSAGDVALVAYQSGTQLRIADQFFADATETLTFATASGVRYVVWLVGFEEGGTGGYDVNLAFSSP